MDRDTRIRRKRGFTLIELLIVIGLIGILSALAYPSYRESIRKGRRVEAQAALTELSQFMERYYTENGRYVASNGSAPSLPFAQTPRDGTTALYTLTLTAATESYTVTATPVATGAQKDDRCGTMTLNQIGTRTAARTDCWQR